MKKILVTLSLICFVAFVSNAQTTPTTSSKESVKTTTTSTSSTSAATSTKKACCHKGGTGANCKKGAKNCTKAGADSKAQKTSTTSGSAN